MDEGGWGRGYGGWRGAEGGFLSRIKDEFTKMECVEHNTTIGYNVIIEDGIYEF